MARSVLPAGSPSKRPRWIARVALVALLSVTVLAAPAATAEPYKGPGHQGIVPIGVGGLLAETLPLVGEGVVHIPLEGIPADVCKIELDDGPGYTQSTLVWTPGNETAYVAAEPGERDAAFKVKAHWELDLKGACTVEVTPGGTIWHDPRGRPFIELAFQERTISHDVEPGQWYTMDVYIHNNGTLEDTVNITFQHLRNEWEIRNPTGVVDRRVGPLETIRVGFDLRMPENQQSGTNLVLFDAEATKSGWQDRATLLLRVEGTDAALDTAPKGEDEGRIETHRTGRLPTETHSRTGQVPAPGVVPLLILIGWSIARARARPGVNDGED
jgi:hypothetical protein